MRSDLVFRSLTHVRNRYRLCKLASKATRRFHRPNSRLQDTINDVLSRFYAANPEGEVREEMPAAQRAGRRGTAYRAGSARLDLSNARRNSTSERIPTSASRSPISPSAVEHRFGEGP